MKFANGDRVRIERHGERGRKGTVVGTARRGTALVVRPDDGPPERVPVSCAALLTKPKAAPLDDVGNDSCDSQKNEVK